MTFLNPWFLLGLSAIVIPIIVHLFDFQRPKKVFFTNVRFLRNINEQVNKGLKVKHLLVLLTRILFVIFLVLAFAQPVIKKNGQSFSPDKNAIALYVDNSLSMEQGEADQNALAQALSQANGLVNVFPRNTGFLFTDNDFAGKDQFVQSGEQVKDRLTEVDFSGHQRSAADVLKRQLKELDREQQGKEKEIFWFSDFQKSTIGDLRSLTIPKDAKLNLLPVQNTSYSNIYLDSVWLSNPFIKLNEANTIYLKLHNSGDKKVDNLVLKFYMADKQVSTATANIGPSATELVEMTFSVNNLDAKQCRISFEDSPVSFDNDYYFLLKAAPTVRITSVNNGDNTYVDKVFSNESFFKKQSYTWRNLDYGTYTKSNLLVLEESDKAERVVWESTNKFVKNGGALVVFPGTNIQSTAEALKALGVSATAIPAPEVQDLAKPDIKNPYFADIFQDLKGNINMPAVKLMLNLAGGNRILQAKNGQSFLSEYTYGKGRVFVFAGALNDPQSNFPRHALFVPTMYKLAIASIASADPLAYTFGQKYIELPIESQANEEQAYALTRGEYSLIPNQRKIDDRLVIELPESGLEAGFYDLKSGAKIVKSVAFNYGKEESQLAYYNTEELRKIFADNKQVKVYENLSEEDAAGVYKGENFDMALWKYCLILCLLCLAAEIALIRLMK